MDRVLLPPRTRVWNQGDWYLYFDPYNFRWARVNENGRFILDHLRRYRTLGRIAEEIAKVYDVPLQEACVALDDFVGRLVEEGFLFVDEYEERERLRFGQREFAYAVYLHLTNDCNLHCEYCYNKS